MEQEDCHPRFGKFSLQVKNFLKVFEKKLGKLTNFGSFANIYIIIIFEVLHIDTKLPNKATVEWK